MARNPYRRLLSDSAVDLANLDKEINKLRPYDFSGIRGCESRLNKIKSKLDNIEFHLAFADESTLIDFHQNCRVVAEVIAQFTQDISQKLEAKSWLLKIWNFITLISNIFDTVTRILNFFGIPVRLLPAPRQ